MNGLNIGTAYACSVDGGVPGSPLDGVVCLSVNIISVVVHMDIKVWKLSSVFPVQPDNTDFSSSSICCLV